MSEEIYNRARVREQSIWPLFLYGMSGNESTKTIIFGLYANSYLLGHNYLEDIEAEELQRLVDIYDSNMSELDMDGQNLVLEIASKRYLKAIEIQIKNNALTTKTRQLDADEQEYEAKLAALEVDQEALETKRAQIELARDRAELKNKDLEARVKLEELAQDYVAIEIAQKELEAAKAELKVLTTALRGLEIQLDIANTTCRIAELESSKAGIEVDIEMAKVRTEENKFNSSSESGDISERKLYLAEEDKNQLEYRVNDSDLHARRKELVEEHENTLEDEKNHIEGVLIPKEDQIKTEQISRRAALHDARIQDFTDRETISGDFTTQNELANAHKEGMASDERAHKQALWDKEPALYSVRKAKLTAISNASIAAAETLATADIVTSLTHEIGGM
jgi:hypothetical protein